MQITKITYYGMGREVEIEEDFQRECEKTFLAKCSVVFDDTVMIHNVKILQGTKGRYILMPEKALSDSKADTVEGNRLNKDVFHPVKKDFSQYMSEVVLEGFSVYEKSGIVIFKPV